MRSEHHFFEVVPGIVPAGVESTVEIRPLYEHVRWPAGVTPRVRCYPAEQFPTGGEWGDDAPPRVSVGDGGVLAVSHTFDGEQEHTLVVEPDPGNGGGRAGTILEFRVYSLLPDLFGLRPCKGDFHLHSNRSDGRESPAYVAAACRRIGLDFMAVTDHRRYEPSLEAAAAFKGVPLDLAIFPGEEIHPPDNPVHMVNFGGSRSINAMFAGADYSAALAAKIAANGRLPAGVDPAQWASCCWCFDRIRECGGLGVFCHPYWYSSHRYTPAGAMTDMMFRERPFDAYELIGGFHLHEVESNLLQVARYHEEQRVSAEPLAIVGASDSHGCERGELLGWYWTMVFAGSTSLTDLRTAVRECRAVAVEALPKQQPRAHGPFRLVKYALFLMREYYPLRDGLCAEEGRLMLAHLTGDRDAAAALSERSGRCVAHFDRWAGRGT